MKRSFVTLALIVAIVGIAYAAQPSVERVGDRLVFRDVDLVRLNPSTMQHDGTGEIIHQGVPISDGLIAPAKRGDPIEIASQPHHVLAQAWSVAPDPMTPARTVGTFIVAQVQPEEPTFDDVLAELAAAHAEYNAVAFDEAKAKAKALALIPMVREAKAKREARAQTLAALEAASLAVIEAEGIAAPD